MPTQVQEKRAWSDYGSATKAFVGGLVLTFIGGLWAIADPFGFALIGFGALMLQAGIIGHVIKGVLREVKDGR